MFHPVLSLDPEHEALALGFVLSNIVHSSGWLKPKPVQTYGTLYSIQNSSRKCHRVRFLKQFILVGFIFEFVFGFCIDLNIEISIFVLPH